MNFISIAQRSNQEHDGPLTWGGKPMPYLHLNARSRYIFTEEVWDVYLEEVSR